MLSNIAETFGVAPLSVTYRFDNPILQRPDLAAITLPVKVEPLFALVALGRLSYKNTTHYKLAPVLDLQKTSLPCYTCGALRPLRKSALLSDGTKFESLSTPLQSGIRLLQHLLPAYPSASVTISILKDLYLAIP